ncbi:MAG TPA: TRAP transporter large permease [Geminicoccaceae bacterium]
MSSEAAGLLGVGLLLVLIALRIPIAAAMIIVGGGGFAWLAGTGPLLAQLKTLAYWRFSTYDLSVVPLFMLMGQFATRAGLSSDLFRAANVWIGHFRGGMAMAAVGACAGFGAICGSSLATASTMGQVVLPELRKHGYEPALATGTLAAGGTLGILIPPSVILVIYAIIVEANIVTMFQAALIPGLLATLVFALVVRLYVWLKPEAGPVGDRYDPGERWQATLAIWPVLLIFLLVIGGIYFGVFTPTEAAAIGAFGVGLTALVKGRLNRGSLMNCLLETGKATAMIFLILLGAELLNGFIALSRLPASAALWIEQAELAPMTVMLMMLLVFIVFGCFMDSLSMIILAVPFFWPMLADLDFGMDQDSLKIWFGILALVVVELGLITPPVGLNVFIIHGLADDVPMRETFKGVMPFFVAELFRVALLLAAPGIVLLLPRLLG